MKSLSIESQIVQAKIIQVMCDSQNPHSVEFLALAKKKFMDVRMANEPAFDEAVDELRRYSKSLLEGIYLMRDHEHEKVGR